SCTLLSPERVPWITVDFHMPILALWAPTAQHPDCPFVCIEPWCGACDTVGYSGELADRRVMNHLGAGEHFLNTYHITIH
ncbi:MAG: aldose 1-epimerase family protein, partial [Muribaculaceae bacterium]|nr:aldose 1-epimerase family protein [Muribaculaceae bacterium]